MTKASLFSFITFVALCGCTAAPVPEPTPEGNVGQSCNSHDDCTTPMTYLARSVCPFSSRCIEGTCAVVCPMFEDEPNSETGYNEPVACEENADCHCDRFAGAGMGGCACVTGECVAVVE